MVIVRGHLKKRNSQQDADVYDRTILHSAAGAAIVKKSCYGH